MFLIFSVGSLAVGVALAHVYRVYVLFPTSLVVAILVVGAFLLKDHGTLLALLETAAVVALLQVGYVLGLLEHHLTLCLRSLVKSSTQHRAQGPAHHSRVARRR
jgi:hypothetical protein